MTGLGEDRSGDITDFLLLDGIGSRSSHFLDRSLNWETTAWSNAFKAAIRPGCGLIIYIP
jgi:hypothetical protein